ncbi:MAG: 16S rRNA (uracil(1498)-N(3))-methyltransferase [Brachymonas sp.]|nr:16S rRNA (uracil(1498)-N(3))-methyltransferase [Brachymonas sp.]
MHTGMEITLPPHAARHVQVLRLQPGDAVELFHGGLPDVDSNSPAPLSPCGRGAGGEGRQVAITSPETVRTLAPHPNPLPQGEREQSVLAADKAQPNPTTGWFDATITHMGRSEVRARIGNWHAPLPAQHPPVHIACGVPANERMDWLVEKATELGASSIQPLMTARSVLRLQGDRATKRVAHWQGIAIAACEQSGRTVVPHVKPVMQVRDFLAQGLPHGQTGLVLSLQPQAQPLSIYINKTNNSPTAWHLLSGPEGGLSAEEEQAALQQGWLPATLGTYTLRAETAPLAALVHLAVG